MNADKHDQPPPRLPPTNCSALADLAADIRNKLGPSTTIAEVIINGDTPTTELCQTALGCIDHICSELDKFQQKWEPMVKPLNFQDHQL